MGVFWGLEISKVCYVFGLFNLLTNNGEFPRGTILSRVNLTNDLNFTLIYCQRKFVESLQLQQEKTWKFNILIFSLISSSSVQSPTSIFQKWCNHLQVCLVCDSNVIRVAGDTLYIIYCAIKCQLSIRLCKVPAHSGHK